MSFKKVENKDTNKYEIEFLIEKDKFDAAKLAAYKKNVKKMNVPGFRKGKAPMHIVEKMYGAGVFYEDAINDCIPAAYTEAEIESKLEVVSRPEFDIDAIDDEGVHIKATVYTKPEVKIKDYLGMTATKEPFTVENAEVDEEIEHTRSRNSRIIDVNDRAAKNEDTVTIDFDGYVDGKQFDGGKAEKYELKLGSGQFIPGFEEQIIDKNIGDEFDVEVKFPDDYHAEELKGKPAVFKVKLHEIKETQLPALDDEFAKDVSDFDTLDAYKADVKAKITEKKEKQADSEVEEQLINGLIDRLEAEIPEAMYETETENFVRDYDNRLRMQGLDLSTYFKYTGQSLDDLRKQMRPQAERQVKTRLALEEIAKLEKITASDEEIEEEYARIATAYGMEKDKVKELVDKDGVTKAILVKKAVDLVKAKAVVTTAKKEKKEKTEKKDDGEKKAPTKKKAAKTDKKAE